MKYGAYHVWLRVKGLTADEREAAVLSLEKADQGWEWDFAPEQDGSIWIAPLIKGDNPDSMDQHAVRAVRSMLPRRPMGQAEVELYVERFERRR
jgi:hypothetical protein